MPDAAPSLVRLLRHDAEDPPKCEVSPAIEFSIRDNFELWRYDDIPGAGRVHTGGLRRWRAIDI